DSRVRWECRRRARRGRTSSAARTQRIVNGLAKVLDRVRADERLAIDQERRRAAHAELAALGEVRLDGGPKRAVIETPLEPLAIEVQIDGVADERVTLEARLAIEEDVVIRPVASLLAGAARGLVSRHRERVGGQREVFVDQAHPPIVLLQDLIQRPLDSPAKRSLIIGELDDRDRRGG